MSLELNKIAASVLTAGVVAMGSGFIADLLLRPDVPEEPVYKVAMQEDSGGGQQQDKADEPKGPEPIKPLLASADPEAGRQAMQVCAACHSFEKGGANMVGPNLYGVVGNPIAGDDSFNYSDALSGKEGDWTYENLNAYLENPSGWAPGTNMSYNGIKDAEKRANVIAWLRQNDDDPMALPTEEEMAAAEQASGGDGDQGEGGDQAQDGSAEQDGGQQQAAAGDTGGDGSDSGGDGASAGAGSELAQRLANASASAGEGASQVCVACHSFEQGGPNKVGPNLYNVVGKDIASHEGFNYSDALSGKEGVWTWAKLDAYLANPNGWAPGNKMTYPGVKDPAKRADVLLYLASFGDAPELPGAGGGSAGDGSESGDGGDGQQQGDAGSDAAGDDQKADAGTGGDQEQAQAQEQAETQEQAQSQEQEQAGGQQAEGDGTDGASGAGETQQAAATSGDEASGEEASGEEASGGGDGGGPSDPLLQKIAAADPATGKSASQICAACHSFEKGGANMVGPNLYNVVGADIASHEGFNYSDALKGKDGSWTYQKLDAYLENPNGWAPGNKMTYPGVKDDAKRAAVIAYLREQAENPPPLK